jgi:hypothetical protein
VPGKAQNKSVQDIYTFHLTSSKSKLLQYGIFKLRVKFRVGNLEYTDSKVKRRLANQEICRFKNTQRQLAFNNPSLTFFPLK